MDMRIRAKIWQSFYKMSILVVVKDGPIYDSYHSLSATFDNGLDDDLIRYMKDAVNGFGKRQSSKYLK